MQQASERGLSAFPQVRLVDATLRCAGAEVFVHDLPSLLRALASLLARPSPPLPAALPRPEATKPAPALPLVTLKDGDDARRARSRMADWLSSWSLAFAVQADASLVMLCVPLAGSFRVCYKSLRNT